MAGCFSGAWGANGPANTAPLPKCSRAKVVSRSHGPAQTRSPPRPPKPQRPECCESKPPPRAIASEPRTRFPPANTATASEVAAPAAYASSRNTVLLLAPSSAAPVRIRPRIGPAHGAHSNPVATPSSRDRPTLGFPSEPAEFCETAAQPHQRPREPVRQRRPKQRQPENRQHHQSRDAAVLIGAHRPSAAGRGNRGERRKRERHPRQQAEARSFETAGPLSRIQTEAPAECTG